MESGNTVDYLSRGNPAPQAETHRVFKLGLTAQEILVIEGRAVMDAALKQVPFVLSAT
jgi:hypothetical protein